MNKLAIICMLIISSVTLCPKAIFAQDIESNMETVFQYNETSDCFYCFPKNYGSNTDKLKKYPLVIYLHGGGGYGNINGLNFLGYSADDGNIVATEFRNQYPSFVLVPQSKRGWNPDNIIPIVEEFKLNHRVDTTRIYLIGYSMGGSGSYALLNAYYDYNKTLFAGLIRLAGQSQSILREEVAHKTAVWLHVGLDDVKERIEVIRNAYNFLKLNNTNTIETTEEIIIDDVSGVVNTLKVDNKSKIKKTEYNNVGHGIYRFPFDDKRLMSWLFDQKLE